MNFKQHLADLVMDGTKTATRRGLSPNPNSPWFAGRCAYQPGKRFAVCPGRGKHGIGHAIVDAVEKVRVGAMTDEDARAEGCRDLDHFRATWEAINGPLDPTQVVWCVTFHADRSCTCGHIACVCDIKRLHAEGCKFRLSATCPVGIECRHGYDVCPECDPCTCPKEPAHA